MQETYLRAYAAFGSYRGQNTRAWLAAICLNAARSQARRRRRRPWEVPSRVPLEELPVDGAGGRHAGDVADAVIAGLDAQAVARCLALLPEPQRVCIVLTDVAGYTARETAEALGCPARHGAGPGAPGSAPAGPAAHRGGGESWTAMTAAAGCWRRSWPAT